MTESGARTLRELYERQITERGFRADPAQLAVVGRLDALRARLIAAHRAAAPSRGRLLRSLGAELRQRPNGASTSGDRSAAARPG